MINAAGALDRERMRSLVFSDPTARHRLEQIVHPLVGIKIAQETQIATASGTPCIVYDIPLLVESAHWRKSLDHILVVDCQSTTQIARVVERSQLQASDVQKIIDSQASRIERLHAADSVLFNDGCSIQALEAKVRQFAPQFGLSFPAPENLA